MAKIQRYEGNLQAFASAATGQERVIFGNDDSPPVQSDDLTTNINSNFARGWGVLPLGNKPPREWFNSVAFAATQLSAYQHQVGVPEWDDEQEYHTGSYAQIDGFLFRSTSDDNIGNDPQTDAVNWTLDLSPVKTLDALILLDFTLPDGTVLDFGDSGGAWIRGGSGAASEYPSVRGDASATDATGAVWSLMGEMVNPLWLGATGDDSTDDSLALQAAFSSGKSTLDGAGKRYVCSDSLQLDTMTVQNIKIRFTGGVGGSLFRAVNSYGSSVSLTADASYLDRTLTLSSTSGLSENDWVFLSSNGQWSNDGSEVVTQGESVQILSVDSGTQVTLCTPVDSNYLTADGAAVQVVSSDKNSITIKDVEIEGQGAGFEQYGCVFARITDLKMHNFKVSGFDKGGVLLEGVIGFDVSGCKISDSFQSAFGYNMQLNNANRNGVISDCTFSGGRTGITQGGTSGVGRDVVICNNIFSGHYTAAANTKGASCGFIIDGNTCVGTAESVQGVGDGIRVRGRDCVVSNNVVRAYGRHPIACFINGDRGFAGGCTVTGNKVFGAVDAGIYVSAAGADDAGLIVISGNTLHMQDVATKSVGGISVRSTDVDIEAVNITGNIVINCSFNGVDVRGLGTGQILRGVQSSNLADLNATATTAGRQRFVQINAVNYVIDESGSGSPEGDEYGGVGSTFRRTDGGAGTSLYQKESGTGNTGWVAK